MDFDSISQVCFKDRSLTGADSDEGAVIKATAEWALIAQLH